MMRSLWTPEMDKVLRDHAAQGFSRMQIAKEIYAQLNVAVSRNAVCGRAARLGIGETVKRSSQMERAKKALESGNIAFMQALKRRARPKNRTAIGTTTPVGDDASTPQAPTQRTIAREQAWEALPESRRVSIVDLRAGVCHWPLWDAPDTPDKTYCGADCAFTARYCLRHTALAKGQGTPSERTAHKAVLA